MVAIKWCNLLAFRWYITGPYRWLPYSSLYYRLLEARHTYTSSLHKALQSPIDTGTYLSGSINSCLSSHIYGEKASWLPISSLIIQAHTHYIAAYQPNIRLLYSWLQLKCWYIWWLYKWLLCIYSSTYSRYRHIYQGFQPVISAQRQSSHELQELVYSHIQAACPSLL